ncbi:MAG: preprotein translocase subunit SecE [Acutalibacteraceae bacterium]
MADKEKKAGKNSEVDKTATGESKAAEKVAKAAKGSGKKSDKPNVFVRMGRSAKRFFKDFKGESKKIVWPDAKTVLKSTGVVILVVALVSVVIYGIDQGLSAGISGLKKLAVGEETTVSAEVETDDGEDAEAAEDEETTAADEEDTEAEEETTAEETTAEETTAEETTTQEAE